MNPRSEHAATPRRVRYDAAAIACPRLGAVAPGALLVELDGADGPTLLAAGRPADLDARPDLPPPDETAACPGEVLIPPLVNAHTHLDLTHVGPRPHDPADGFAAWIDAIRAARLQDDDAIAASVDVGIRRSLAGAVVAVGDIAGCPGSRQTAAPFRQLARSGLMGVSYLEYFGIGLEGAASSAERLSGFLIEHAAEIRGVPDVTFGFSPHATNTIDLDLYDWTLACARQRGTPICTHLAESIEERRFIADAEGPQRAFLERLGVWHPSILRHIGRGRHPVAHLAPFLDRASAEGVPVLCAHVNDCPDDALDVLARSGTSVAYCPRASAYFGTHADFGPHRYADMLAYGINVCLGTDSVVNCGPIGAERITPFDDMKVLFERDGADPLLLLEMATTNGARALGLDPAWFTFEPGPLAGVASVRGPDLGGALSGQGGPRLLLCRNRSCVTE